MKLKDFVELMNQDDFFELVINDVHNYTTYHKETDFSEYENYEVKEFCIWDEQTLMIFI